MKLLPSSPVTEWRPKTAHGETVGYAAKARQALERGERNVCRSIFRRPIRGLKFFFSIQPTVSPWAVFRRASGALAAMVLFFAVGATAATTNTLSDAEIQGRQLAQQLLEQRPVGNFTNTGVLKITGGSRGHTNILITFKTLVLSNSWRNVFDAEGWTAEISIVHKNSQPNTYFDHAESDMILKPLSDSEKNSSFAHSDFSIADLGLDFFHWPEQKILKKEVKRSRGCTVLESANPKPWPGGYSRIVSWIDSETLGIVQAEAYDAKGKLLKEFYPKNFKKVKGQWQVENMEIDNVQTGSRTRLEFDLKAP